MAWPVDQWTTAFPPTRTANSARWRSAVGAARGYGYFPLEIILPTTVFDARQADAVIEQTTKGAAENVVGGMRHAAD
jgi:hypothetical protein